METRDQIQAVINTLEDIEMRCTYSNLQNMYGSMQMLMQIRDSMVPAGEPETCEIPPAEQA